MCATIAHVNAPAFSIARLNPVPPEAWQARLSDAGLGLRVGPFDLHLRVTAPGVAEALHRLYRDHPVLEGDRVYSCHALLEEVRHWRRPHRRVRFSVDGLRPHEDMPSGQGLAVLEWGLNLVIAMRFHCFLMLHAAVLERHGRALILPASPGHGKSTLCAALAHRGWRLLSDEFGLLRPGGADLLPVPRPMPLKNQSIEVISRFAPEAEFGPTIHNTRKGTVAHVKPPADSVARAAEPARAGWVVFPRWSPDVPLTLEPVGRGEAFVELATHAFNYELLGEAGYATVSLLTRSARCHRLLYSDLDRAVEVLTHMADDDA